jgi:beta-glucosidase
MVSNLNEEINNLVKQKSSLVKEAEGVFYRDLNKNGKLDIYEDPRQPIETRVEDLLSQMTLEEKAGTLFINGSVVSQDGSIDDPMGADAPRLSAKAQMSQHKMTHFNLWAIPSVKALSTWYNQIQAFAEQTRLGIPLTIASDPRNHFSHNIFDMLATEFSQWPNAIGFGAIGDPEAVRQFAEFVRREYLAAGIRMALHPQIDLATEPRWPRIPGTFGEDAQISAALAKAYIEGLQGDQLGPTSVACMTKHFPGGGPQNEGWDAHFEFQKGQVYPGNNFDYHLIPFEAAFKAGTAAIMPYYGVPMDQTDENVGMSYNKAIITGLLREKYHYDGVVCTDWGLVTDTILPETVWPARAWGVEHLSRLERVQKILEAGADQFGGESCPELVVELVEKGLISEDRIDQSVRRLLRMKFQLGLFDNPFVDEDLVPQVFGNPEAKAAGESAQKRAMTLLKNEEAIFPLQGGPKLYLKNIRPEVAARYGKVVDSPEEADFAIVHLDTPWYPVETKNRFALSFHHGDLDFKEPLLSEILAVLKQVPTIVVMYMDRPAVIPEIDAACKALLVEYGASDESILEVVFGRSRPEGKLPFELPSSMEAVRKQKADVPHDSENPLYPFGFALPI